MQAGVFLLIAINLAAKVLAVLLLPDAPGRAVAVWLLGDGLVLYHLLVPGAQGVVPAYRSFATARREVWLTIDDGPDPEDTPRVLASLRESGARATFFVIGEQAERHPELIRAILADGHEVGHHTQTHPLATFWCAGPARVRAELARPLAVLAKAGVTPRWFRSPAGVKNFWLQKALGEHGLVAVGWSVRGLESASRDVESVVARVKRGLAPGAIVLVHEGPRLPQTMRVQALRAVLALLRDEGYACVLPAAAQLRFTRVTRA